MKRKIILFAFLALILISGTASSTDSFFGFTPITTSIVDSLFGTTTGASKCYLYNTGGCDVPTGSCTGNLCSTTASANGISLITAANYAAMKTLQGYPTTYSDVVSYWTGTKDSSHCLAGDGSMQSIGDGTGWTAVTAYTTIPASTSTIIMTSDLTAIIPTGSPIKYVIGGTTYYGQVFSLTSNLMTIRGVSLSGTITSLYWGGVQHLRQRAISIPGNYELSSTTTALEITYSNFVWRGEPAYLVGYNIYSYTADSGTKGQVDITLNGNLVNTTTNGLTVNAAKTWYNTIVDINPTYYLITYGQTIDVAVTKNGTGDAAYLSVELRFVYP